MTTTDAGNFPERVAQQLAAVLIAAVRPDPAGPEAGPDPQIIGAAVERLGTELEVLLRHLEPRGRSAEDTVPNAVNGDSAVARAAHLAAQIMLSGTPRAMGVE